MAWYKKIAAVIFGFLMLAAVACGGGEKNPVNADDSVFPFDDPQTVGLGYGSTTMEYPFAESKNYMQIYVGNSTKEEPAFTYTVDGALTVTVNSTLDGFTQICFRIYSTEFDSYAAGTPVRVSMQLKMDPAMSSYVFMGYNDAGGTEAHNTKLPKTGNFSEVAFDTAIETSSGFYRNNYNSGNQKNVMFMFVRIGMGEVFSIDSITFTFS